MTGRPRAYLTPDTLSGTVIIRQLAVPVELLHQVGGALGELLETYRWEQFGSLTADETIQEVHKMIDFFYDTPFIGMIAPFALFPIPSEGWLLLAGQTVSQADYPELSIRVPPSWKSGGNITLPNMQERFLMGSAFSAPLGSAGGSNSVTLTTAQMPEHTHSYQPPAVNPDLEGPGVPDVGATIIGPPAVTGPAGGGEAHENRPQYLAVSWVIFAGRVP